MKRRQLDGVRVLDLTRVLAGPLCGQMLGDLGEDQAELEALDVDIEIAEGGAAAMAFARLQFEDLSPETRAAIKAALLRYCELDTLAMVMIAEAWREWASPA